MNCTDRFHDDPRNAPLRPDGVPAGVIFCGFVLAVVAWAVALRIMAGWV